MTKAIALGSRLMMDDGIGPAILDRLAPGLAPLGVEPIWAETDAGYALSRLKGGDRAYLLDAMILGLPPGSVRIWPLREAMAMAGAERSAHHVSLLQLIATHGMSVDGLFIGIEAAQIEFGLELSHALAARFGAACAQIRDIIENDVRSGGMHDMFLFDRISDSLVELCRQNGIKTLGEFTVSVHAHSHVDEPHLMEHLREKHPELVGAGTRAIVKRDNPAEMVAVIERVEGEDCA